MNDTDPNPRDPGLLADMERRQDELLARLDELNRRIEAALAGAGSSKAA